MPTDDPNALLLALLLALGVVIVGLVSAVWLLVRDRTRGGREPSPLELQAWTENREREQKMFEQNQDVHRLGTQKMQREIELLDIQLQLARHELAMRHEHRDHHDLLMDKTRLEIESLGQHIKEQKKRNEDFRGED